MKTIFTPCQVPWAISPSMSGLTLIHTETGVEPECTAVFGGGRLDNNGFVDSRRIEIEFVECYYTRTGPLDDDQDIESIDYTTNSAFTGNMDEYLDWRSREWQQKGVCPDSGFYVTNQSPWLSMLPTYFHDSFFHYLLTGRDGYVEVIARRYGWKEWLWINGNREDSIAVGDIVGSGERED